MFDEDKNGVAVIEDVSRVLKTYTEMSVEDQEKFVKICQLGPALSEEQLKADLKSLNMPEGFQIKSALSHLFNI